MDTTAISLCMNNQLPIIVFNLNVPGNLKRVVMGEKIGRCSLVAPGHGVPVERRWVGHGKRTLAQAKTRMAKAAEDLRVELAAVRTGRASTALLEHLKVEYYGTHTPLNQVATLGVPDPSMITVQPWDPSLLSDDREGHSVLGSGIKSGQRWQDSEGAHSSLTEERRKELVKHLHKVMENHRTAVRNIRRDSNEELKKLLKDKKISEDDERRGLEEIQKLTDDFMEKLEGQAKSKEREIMEMR